MIREFDSYKPQIDSSAFIHDSAEIIGRVKIGSKASVWPFASLRGDIEEIIIGEGTNIQDNTVIHTEHDIPTVLGKWISVGHSAILHGCRVDDHCLVGMGAILLNGCVVEEECLIGAGTLVSPGMKIPKGHLALGVPARVVRPLRQKEIQHLYKNAENYVGYSQKHIKTSKRIEKSS